MAVLRLNQRRRKRRVFGPYSKLSGLTQVDGRCRAARAVREFSKDLVAHLGGSPSPAEAILIRECAIKNAKLTMLADKVLDAADVDLDCCTRTYLAWSNSLRRDLEALGLKAPEQKAPELSEFLAARKGRAA